MRTILIIIIFSLAGCADNDKKAPVNNVETTVASEGEVLLKANCAACHKVDKDFTGPALKGALERWGNDKKAMYDFIRNSSQSESAYAKAVKQKWAPVIMTSFNLSDAELDSIMNYVENHVNTVVVQTVAD